MSNKPGHDHKNIQPIGAMMLFGFTGEQVLATKSPTYTNIKDVTVRTWSDLQVEKLPSNALNTAAVSNLKFLKLFPGPVSGGLASD